MVSKKKADDEVVQNLMGKGNPPLVRFPSVKPSGLTFTPSVAL